MKPHTLTPSHLITPTVMLIGMTSQAFTLRLIWTYGEVSLKYELEERHSYIQCLKVYASRKTQSARLLQRSIG
jgi:hypothetical protein